MLYNKHTGTKFLYIVRVNQRNMQLIRGKDQPAEIQNNKTVQANQQHNAKDAKPEERNNTSPEQGIDNDDDLLMKEGYLPEIYFSLRSDNPADW